MHPFFHLLGRPIPAYWLMAVVGGFAFYFYAWATNRRGKAGQLPSIDVLHIFLLALVGALVGAKAFSALVQIPRIIRHWDYFMQNPASILSVLATGLVFYGGFVGAVAAVFWYCRRYSVSFAVTVSIFTPAVPLFHVFGRIGCFLGGCCWGMEVPWGIAFSQSLAAPNHVRLFPVQLVESGLNLILFVVLAVLSRRLSRKWMVFPIYVIAYGILRFVLEFFRGDVGRGLFLFSTSQWVALLCIAATTCFLFVQRKKRGTAAT